jgi:hypothetical protein
MEKELKGSYHGDVFNITYKELLFIIISILCKQVKFHVIATNYTNHTGKGEVVPVLN